MNQPKTKKPKSFADQVAKSTMEEQAKERQKKETKQSMADVVAAGGQVTTPAGGALVGQTPDQAKMQGTPNAALGRAKAQADRLKDAEEDQLVQTHRENMTMEGRLADAKAVAAKAFTEDLKDMGAFANRVESKVMENTFKDTDKEAYLSAIDTSPDKIEELLEDPANLDDATAAMSKYSKQALKALEFEIGSDEYIKEKKKAIGILQEATKYMKNKDNATIQALKGVYDLSDSDMQGMVADAIAGGTLDPMQMNLEDLAELGIIEGTVSDDGTVTYDDLGGMTSTQLQDMFGEEWKTMTPEQWGQAIDSKIEEDLTRTRKAQEVLANPSASANAKKAALKELERLGATGVISNESMAPAIAQGVKDAGAVMYGGKLMELDILLADDFVSNEVQQFLLGEASGKPYKVEGPDGKMVPWETLHSEFATFISEEMENIEITQDMLDKTAEEYATINEDNITFLRDSGFNQDVMDVFGFKDGWGATKFEPNQNKLFEFYSNASDEEKANLVANINGFSKSDLTELSQMLSGDDPTAIQDAAKSLYSVFSGSAGDTAVKALQIMDKVEDLKLNVGAKASDYAEAMGIDPTHYGKIEDTIAGISAGKAWSGEAKEVGDMELYLDLFDSNRDGRIDTPAQLAVNFEQNFSKDKNMGLASIVNGTSTMHNAIKGSKEASTHEPTGLGNIMATNGVLHVGDLDDQNVSTVMKAIEANHDNVSDSAKMIGDLYNIEGTTSASRIKMREQLTEMADKVLAEITADQQAKEIGNMKQDTWFNMVLDEINKHGEKSIIGMQLQDAYNMAKTANENIRKNMEEVGKSIKKQFDKNMAMNIGFGDRGGGS